MNQIGPEWIKPAFDQRFNERARQAGRQMEIERLQNRQRKLEKMLKISYQKRNMSYFLNGKKF
ncbi:hypothetical protein PACILC2_43860 [Paenibacillus cisolokensis]|uniref:Uncharacterized protein n=1 Tax=Paenibacillus cisolokensis TaxID=1658519 RepID=A0ABQ4NC67_9BACL|nr:hypothetical protein [Paenibacillus cisolokensis]GIQ65818.1 hypothetical protein PACILC2_43860 [Paenibacillus cisolokensis]